MLKRPELKELKIEDGAHEATCIKVEEITVQWRDQPAEPGVRFIWEVIDNDGYPQEMQRRTPIRRGSKSFLRLDMVAIHGQGAWDEAMRSDEAFDALIKSTIGKTAIVTVLGKKDEAGFTWKNIVGITPQPRKAPKRVAPPAETAEKKLVVYDLKAEPDEGKREKIRDFFVKAGATFENGSAITEKEYPKLAYLASGYKDVTTSYEEDDVPF